MRTPLSGKPALERLRWPGTEPLSGEAAPDRAVIGRTFTYLYGAGGLLALGTLLLPHGDGRSVAGIAGAGIAALTVAVATALFAERVPIGLFRWLPVLGTVLVTIVVSSADPGATIPYTAFYFWVILSAFYLFDARWAWANVALVAVALAVTLAGDTHLDDRALAWVMVMGALSVGGGMIGLLRQRLEHMVEAAHDALARALYSEQALAEAQRIAQIGSWEVNLVTRGFYGSPQLLRMIGLSDDATVTLEQVMAGVGPRERTSVADHFRAAVRETDTLDIEYEIRLPSGQTRLVHTLGQVVRDGERPVRIVGTTEDITERRRREDELQRTLRRLRATIDIALALGQEPDPAGLLRLISERAQSLLEARSVFVLLGDGDDAQPVAVTGDAPLNGDGPAGGPSLRAALSYRGVTHGVLVALPSPERARFSAEDEEMLRAFASSAAAAVAGAKMVQQDTLRRSIEASEGERRRVARELHDQTLQTLGLLRMRLTVELEQEPGPPPPHIEAALRVIDEEVENLRRIIADLRPALLDDLGLGAALEAMVERLRHEYELEIDMQIELDDERLSSETERTIYRVVQECLTNIWKHADASCVKVTVRCEDGAVNVCVEDDGRGLDPHATDGFGLAGMRERLRLLGGSLSIESSTSGTSVEAALPSP